MKQFIRNSIVQKIAFLLLCLWLVSKSVYAQVIVPDSVKARLETAVDSLESERNQGEQAIERDTLVVKERPKTIPSISEVISYGKIYWSIIVLILTYAVSRFILSILDSFAERSSDYRLFFKRLIPVVRLLIWIMSLYFIIEGIIDPPVETLFAMLASIGLAIGFASQDILKNFFGGFMIILDRPFQVGDKIMLGSDYGEVLQIGLRSTRIVTPDDSVITIPNGELMNKAVSNSNSGALDCQVVAEVYISANSDLTKARRLAYLAAATSKYVYMQKPIVIGTVSEIIKNQLYMKFRIKAYVLDIRYEFPLQTDMAERTIQAWKDHGIQGFT
ncbi:MAG: mechanosensitive ion channel [Bacteroidetes bacterium]|nr:mechanosensitive ion channel [Bacteroidota bacterium]